MHKAYKTQLRPTPDQRSAFRQWAGCSRYVYNWGLERRIQAYEKNEESLSLYEQDKAMTQFKKQDEYAWLGDPPRRVLYFALRDLDAAFQNFFRRVKSSGEAPGFPRWKAKGRSKESFTIYGTDVKITDDAIRLPKMGWVRLEEKGYIPTDAEKYGEVTVSQDVDKWYVSVVVEVEPNGNAEKGAPMALHPGVRKWISLTGDHAEPDLPLEKISYYEKRLKRQQRQLARKKQGSRNRERLKKRIGKTHRKIRNLRENATHQATAYICYTLRPSHLIVQDWSVRQMLEQQWDNIPRHVQKKIRHALSNANLGELTRQLQYKSEWAGIEYVEIQQDVPVSKRCSRCDHVHDTFGAQKDFVCPACGFEVDREKNALRNLMKEFERLDKGEED